jgi:hypothetical protein
MERPPPDRGGRKAIAPLSADRSLISPQIPPYVPETETAYYDDQQWHSDGQHRFREGADAENEIFKKLDDKFSRISVPARPSIHERFSGQHVKVFVLSGRAGVDISHNNPGGLTERHLLWDANLAQNQTKVPDCANRANANPLQKYASRVLVMTFRQPLIITLALATSSSAYAADKPPRHIAAISKPVGFMEFPPSRGILEGRG